jgi:hypothetical protein
MTITTSKTFVPLQIVSVASVIGAWGLNLKAEMGPSPEGQTSPVSMDFSSELDAIRREVLPSSAVVLPDLPSAESIVNDVALVSETWTSFDPSLPFPTSVSSEELIPEAVDATRVTDDRKTEPVEFPHVRFDAPAPASHFVVPSKHSTARAGLTSDATMRVPDGVIDDDVSVRAGFDRPAELSDAPNLPSQYMSRDTAFTDRFEPAPRAENKIRRDEIHGSTNTSFHVPAGLGRGRPDVDWLDTLPPTQVVSNARSDVQHDMVKVFKLQLVPRELGTLDVTMRVQAGVTVVELITSDALVMQNLTKDTAELVQILEAAGVAIDDVSVKLVAAPVSHDNQNTSRTLSSEPGVQSGFSSENSGTGGQSRHSFGGDSDRRHLRDTRFSTGADEIASVELGDVMNAVGRILFI